MDATRFLYNAVVRQVPITVIFLIAAVVSGLVDSITVSSVPLLVWSIAVAGVATVLSVVGVVTADGRISSALFVIVPAIDFVAVALLRTATGASTSVYTSLLLLPVLWLASLDGIRYVAYTVAGSVAVILAPLALQPGTTLGSGGIVRLIVSVIVFGTVAAVINILATQSRLKVRAAQEHEGLIREEIDRAAVVQRSLLPDEGASLGEGFTISGVCLPAKSVGGDFFDWYATPDGIALTLGDVMGKGMAAGLIAAAVRAAVRSAHAVDDPREALLRASDGLSVARNSTEVTFTTLFHARLSNDGELRWVDAGHGLSAIFRADGEVEYLDSADLPLGLQLEESWKTRTTRLDPADMLVSVSDGVLDLFGGELDTLRGMARIAQANPDPAAVVAALSELAGRTPHDDDVTVVALRREPVLVSA